MLKEASEEELVAEVEVYDAYLRRFADLKYH